MLAESNESYSSATCGTLADKMNDSRGSVASEPVAKNYPVAPEPLGKDVSCQVDVDICSKKSRTIGTQTSFHNNRRSKGKDFMLQYSVYGNYLITFYLPKVPVNMFHL